MSDPTAHGRLAAAVSRDLPLPAVALAVGAHPDDVEFGCGATLAKWAAAGCEVHHLVCTDGSKGSWNPSQDRGRLVERRHQEQRQASIELGGNGRVTFLDWTDGELESGLGQRRQVAAEIRRVRPDVVLSHDPWKRYRLHPDHRHAGFLTTDGIVAARDPHFFPDLGLEPHRPTRLLLWEADEPDHLEDVNGFVDIKIRALLAHRSQFESTMRITDETHLAEFRSRLESAMADAGEGFGMAYAEVFKLIEDL